VLSGSLEERWREPRIVAVLERHKVVSSKVTDGRRFGRIKNRFGRRGRNGSIQVSEVDEVLKMADIYNCLRIVGTQHAVGS
jgi:hypothetical protein